MKFKPSRALVSFLGREAELGKKVLDIRGYEVRFFFKNYIKGHKGILPLEGERGYTFEMDVDHTYMVISISVSKLVQRKFDEGNLREIRQTLYHELAHVLTSHIQDFSAEKLRKKDHEKLIELSENLTQKIANIISIENIGE